MDCICKQVMDMESMKYIMRYNNYKNDSYSLGSPMNAICSRGDLLDPPEAGGCYDTKVIDGQYVVCTRMFRLTMLLLLCNNYFFYP